MRLIIDVVFYFVFYPLMFIIFMNWELFAEYKYIGGLFLFGISFVVYYILSCYFIEIACHALYRKFYLEYEHRNFLPQLGKDFDSVKGMHKMLEKVSVLGSFRKNYQIEYRYGSGISEDLYYDVLIPLIRINKNVSHLNVLPYSDIFENDEFFNCFPNSLFMTKSGKKNLEKLKDMAYVKLTMDKN